MKTKKEERKKKKGGRDEGRRGLIQLRPTDSPSGNVPLVPLLIDRVSRHSRGVSYCLCTSPTAAYLQFSLFHLGCIVSDSQARMDLWIVYRIKSV